MTKPESKEDKEERMTVEKFEDLGELLRGPDRTDDFDLLREIAVDLYDELRRERARQSTIR